MSSNKSGAGVAACWPETNACAKSRSSIETFNALAASETSCSSAIPGLPHRNSSGVVQVSTSTPAVLAGSRAVTSIAESVPVMLDLEVSVAVSDCVPDVCSVAMKVWLP